MLELECKNRKAKMNKFTVKDYTCVLVSLRGG